MDDESVQEFYELWEEQHGGPDGVGGVIALQGGASYTPVTISPVDAQLLQSRQYTREEILGLYAPGLPHHLLGWKSNTSNFGTGVEQQAIHLIQHVFNVRMELVSDVISTMLLPPELKLWWDTTMWLEGDTKAQAEVFQKMRMNGIITREQWRSSARMPALELPDDITIPKNMTTIQVSDGKMLYEPQKKPAPEQTPEQTPKETPEEPEQDKI